MLKSMTGFGSGDGEVGGRKLFIEVKAVNHRYFNFQAKVPSNLSFLEGRIQALVKERLSRGQVTVMAQWDRRGGGPPPVTINFEMARQSVEELRRLKEELNLAGEVEVGHLIGLPGVVSAVDSNLGEDESWKQVEALLAVALDGLEAFRVREGEDLARDLEERLGVFAGYVQEVEAARPAIVAEQKARLEKRLAELVSEKASEEAVAEKVAVEIAVFADRCDVSEELVRLRSHLDKFHELMADDGPVGRKIDFLIQELNREVNTVGSKTPDAGTARLVVEMKAELEKIREQVQNIE